MKVHEVPVLVVGAGPAGSDHRCHARALRDRLPARGTTAAAVDASTRDGSQHAHDGAPPSLGSRAHRRRRRRRRRMADVACGPSPGWPRAPASKSASRPVHRATLVSPTAPACVPQDHLERVLLAHLQSLEPVRVELGRSSSVSRADTRVSAQASALRRARSGTSGPATSSQQTEPIAPSGPALGIQMHGSLDVLAGITALLRAPLWSNAGRPPLRHLRDRASGCREHLPPGRAGRPLGFRILRRSRHKRSASPHTRRNDEADPSRGRAPPTCRCTSTGSARSRRPRRLPSGSGTSVSSSWATPLTSLRRGAAPA